MPLISIIVPIFNGEVTIESTINSILNQTFKDFECILINDASFDNSRKLVENFVNNDKRFVLINNEKNMGVTYSRNEGIKISRGKYLCFLDADDIWMPNFLDLHLSFRRNKPNLAITYSPYYVFSKTNSKIYGYSVKPPNKVDSNNIFQKNHIPLLTVMLDIEIIGKVSFSELRPEDYYLWVELIYKKGFIARSLKSFSAYYRVSNTQRSSNKLLAIGRLYCLYMNNTNNKILSLIYVLRWIFMNLIKRSKKKFIFIKKDHKYIYI
tara:strand:+ start:160 stop:957 length:798 start_codon:yes stop_codon:yes gene_type:complete